MTRSAKTSCAAKDSHRGILLVLSAPSGGGKTRLANALVDDTGMGFLALPSITTRLPRPSEREGVDYNFVGETAFLQAIDDGGFVEWARVHGNLYGTPRGPVDEALACGGNVVLTLDWHGASRIRDLYPLDAVCVFILPPSAEILRARLIGRGEDDAATISKRLLGARAEIARWREYDHAIVNDDFGVAFNALADIVQSEKVRRQRSGRADIAATMLMDEIDRLVEELSEGLELDPARPRL